MSSGLASGSGLTAWLESDPFQNSVKVVLGVVWLTILADVAHAMAFEDKDLWYLLGRILMLCTASVVFVLLAERYFRDRLYASAKMQ